MTDKEALAQPEQAPITDDIASILACREMFDAQPVPPRTWVGSGDIENSNAYLTPPQRKPLTDKAITKVIDSMPKKMKGFGVDWDLYEFARAIEAAHGIKGDT
jgi:hypothetical protein